MHYSESEKGRCLSCGFLSKHPTSGSGLPLPRFYEIEPQERRGNHYMLFRHRPQMAANRTEVRTDLICFIDEADLMLGIPGEEANTDEIRQVRADLGVEAIARDRKCPGWYPYKPGFSPKEHHEAFEMQRLENDRRAFEMQLSDMSLKAQLASATIAEDSKRIVQDLKTIAEKNDTFSRRVTLWVIILAALQAIGTILALPSVPWVKRLWAYLFGF